jgi:hypothetical protein
LRQAIVIPGRCEAPNPESSFGAGLDSGFQPAAGPGMTVLQGWSRHDIDGLELRPGHLPLLLAEASVISPP